MKKKPYILIGLLAAGLIAFFFFKQKNSAMAEDHFISTQGESEQRVKALDLDHASENASYILDIEKLSFPRMNEATEEVEYKPDAETDWIITIQTVAPTSFTTAQLFKLFDKDWRVNYGAASVYGYLSKEKKWTYAIAGGEPEIYSNIQVAINLIEIYDEENATPGKKTLENYIEELQRKLRSLPIKLEFNENIEQAAARGQQLAALKNEFDIEAVIVLKSEKKFDGKLAWDALQSLGLTWGDGDLFHWNNEDNYGHDQHFSVWTTTDPGYFMPEDIKNGSMQPTDLGFGFSFPRSADAKNIFAAMLNAVKYCQQRLGGTILDKEGNPFNEAKEKQYVDDLLQKMKTKGLIPGSDKALRMF